MGKIQLGLKFIWPVYSIYYKLKVSVYGSLQDDLTRKHSLNYFDLIEYMGHE